MNEEHKTLKAYVALSEADSPYDWLPSPGEQYTSPPPNAVCWVEGTSDDKLLENARAKFEGLGFMVLAMNFYAPAPGGRGIHLIVGERTDCAEIVAGSKRLIRQDISQAVRH